MSINCGSYSPPREFKLASGTSSPNPDISRNSTCYEQVTNDDFETPVMSPMLKIYNYLNSDDNDLKLTDAIRDFLTANSEKSVSDLMQNFCCKVENGYDLKVAKVFVTLVAEVFTVNPPELTTETSTNSLRTWMKEIFTTLANTSPLSSKFVRIILNEAKEENVLSSDKFPDLIFRYPLLVHINDYDKFISLAIEKVSFLEWKSKGQFIIDFLAHTPFSTIEELERIEKIACDDKTRSIIQSAIHGIKSISPTETYQAYHEMKQNIPGLTTTNFHYITNQHVPQIEYPCIASQLPPNIRALNFDALNRFYPLKLDDIFFGRVSTSRKKPYYIVAYDTKNNKLLWGRESLGKLVCWSLTNQGLIIGEEGSQFLNVLDSKTGDPIVNIELPEIMQEMDKLHVTPEGFCYFERAHGFKIYGGLIEKNVWEPRFATSAPKLGFRVVDDCIKYYQRHHPKTLLVKKNGDFIKSTEDCKDIFIDKGQIFKLMENEKDGVLYLELERNTSNPIKRIPIGQYKNGRVHGIIESGKWGIVSGMLSRSQGKLFFVNLQTLEAVDSRIVIDQGGTSFCFSPKSPVFFIKDSIGDTYKVEATSEVKSYPKEALPKPNFLDEEMNMAEKIGNFLGFSLANFDGKTLFLNVPR